MASSDNVSSVHRASWPTPHRVMDCLSNSAADDKSGTLMKRGSWWADFMQNKSSTAARSSGGGKRRRSRAVAKPPITRLPAQDKAHFKRIVQLFTGSGSSHASHHLLLTHLSNPPPLASLLLSNTPSSSSSPVLPPLLSSPLLSFSPSPLLSSPLPSSSPPSHHLPHPYLDLDIISALCTPSHSHIVAPSLEESAFFNKLLDSYSLLASSNISDLSPCLDDALGIHSHDSHKDNSLKPTSTPNATPVKPNSDALSTQIQNTPKDTPSTSCSGDHLNGHADLKSSFALRRQIPNTPKDNNPNSTITLCSGDDLNDHVDMKSFFESPLNGNIDLKSSRFQLHNTLEDTNHLPGSCATHKASGASCRIDDGSLLGQVDLKSVGAPLHFAIHDTNLNFTSISCRHDIALNGHVDEKSVFTCKLNGTPLMDITMEHQSCMVRGELPLIDMDNTLNGTSPKDLTNMDQEGMLGEELPPFDMDIVENQAQQQVKEFEQQVKELETFLLKENDKIDKFFSLICLFLEQNTPQCDQLRPMQTSYLYQ